MAIKKTIAVFNLNNVYLSNCTYRKALTLINAGKAIKVNDSTIILNETRKQKTKKKHDIILKAKRICYICNKKIPESENATIDHVIPKSRDSRADIYINMRCCCERCNNDKGNLTISEYVKHILKNRENYLYITDKRIQYLKNFAKYYEAEFNEYVNSSNRNIKIQYNNNHKKGKKQWKRK